LNRRGVILLAAAAVATLVVEWVYRHQGHAVSWWHELPSFDLLFGFAGCAAIVLASKALGHSWLQRPESYDEDDPV
jgi:hypothetical protein